MPNPPKPTPEARIRNARRAGNQAMQRAAERESNQSVHRATRTRHVYKEKADGLDRVMAILAGRK